MPESVLVPRPIYFLVSVNQSGTKLFRFLRTTLAAPAAPVPREGQTCSAMPVSVDVRKRDSIENIQCPSTQ